jgi:hypothetical protein
MASCSCFFRHQNVYLYIPNLIGERSALNLLDQYHRAANIFSWILTRVNIVCRLYAHRADPGSSRLRLQPPRALCGDLFPGVSNLRCGSSVDQRLLYVQGFCGTSNSSHLLFGCFVDGMILARSAANEALLLMFTANAGLCVTSLMGGQRGHLIKHQRLGQFLTW